MRRIRPEISFLIVLVVILAGGAGLTWVNQNILVPLGGDQVYAPIWEASRVAMETRAADPYSAEAVRLSAMLLGEGGTPRFVYPYYSLVLFGPFARISPYSLSRAVWMTFNFFCAVGLAFTAVQLTRWRPGVWGTLFFVLFAFGRVEVIRALWLGNPALVISLIIAIAMLLVIRGRDVGAGILFGLTMIKPEMVALLLPFVLVWAVSKRRMSLVWSMLGVMVVLVAGSLVIAPQWLLNNYMALLDFYQAGFPASPAAFVWVWTPDAGPWAMGLPAVLLAGVMLISWWAALGRDERWFLWTAALTLVITQLIGLPTSLSSQVVLVIPFVLVFSVWAQRWPRQGRQLSQVVMALILNAEWGLFWLTMGGDLAGRPADVFWFLMPVTALVLLYWVRYWALSSIQLRTGHLEALRRL